VFRKILIANRGENKALRAAVSAQANCAQHTLSSLQRAAGATLPAHIDSHV
jgi:hypothetical protein